jgi:hypothetical protein
MDEGGMRAATEARHQRLKHTVAPKMTAGDPGRPSWRFWVDRNVVASGAPARGVGVRQNGT